MDDLKRYFLTIIAASVICFVATGLTGKKGTTSALIRMICGLFMVLTVIKPFANIRLDDFTIGFTGVEEHHSVVSYGESVAQEEMSSIIKEQVTAYILDKATALHMDVSVEVVMSASQPCLPEKVTITGTVSPYGKQRMEEVLSGELGIAKENQLWE